MKPFRLNYKLKVFRSTCIQMADLGRVPKHTTIHCLDVYVYICYGKHISPEKHCMYTQYVKRVPVVPSAVGITEIEIYEMVKTKDVHYSKALP